MAPFRALCLRFAAALWPERHKSYTAVIGARYEKTIGTRNLILNEDYLRCCFAVGEITFVADSRFKDFMDFIIG